MTLAVNGFVGHHEQTHLVVIDGADAVQCQSHCLLLPGDDYLVLGQAGWRYADAGACVLAQFLHQPVVGAGDERVEDLLQGEALHGALVLVRRGGGVRQTTVRSSSH